MSARGGVSPWAAALVVAGMLSGMPALSAGAGSAGRGNQ